MIRLKRIIGGRLPRARVLMYYARATWHFKFAMIVGVIISY